MNKIFKLIKKIFSKLYGFLDKFIITPISRLLYFLGNKLKGNNKHIEKLLNRSGSLVYISLLFAVLIFFLIDKQVISLVETEAEILSNQPVTVLYNKEAYVVEGLVEKVDIILTGRKSAIYLAKQLGDHEVVLDLTDYEASDKSIQVALTYNQTVENISYKLDPSYVTVTIKQKISETRSVTVELLNENKMNEKLSVSSVELSKTSVVVKGSSEALEEIATVKALVDLSNSKFTEANTYSVDSIPLKAYDSDGNLLDDIEIVPSTLTATIVLDSYSASVPLSIQTTGDLVTGKAISSITINGKSSYSITVYGEEDVISKYTNSSFPVVIDVSGQGNTSPWTYNATLSKPTGINYLSDTEAKITVTFGDEKQKTVALESVEQQNLSSGLKATITSLNDASIQVKGVQSVIDSISAENITAYIDLSGYTAGDYEVEVLIENTDPRLNYVVTSKISINISTE